MPSNKNQFDKIFLSMRNINLTYHFLKDILIILLQMINILLLLASWKKGIVRNGLIQSIMTILALSYNNVLTIMRFQVKIKELF